MIMTCGIYNYRTAKTNKLEYNYECKSYYAVFFLEAKTNYIEKHTIPNKKKKFNCVSLRLNK